MGSSIHELAGQQEDPLIEEVIAILFSDRPVRSMIRPEDSRRHWQWMARDPAPDTSRLWLSFGQPITDDTPGEIEVRCETALAILVPTYATAIEATATQVAFDEIDLQIVITTPRQERVTVGLLVQGGM